MALVFLWKENLTCRKSGLYLLDYGWYGLIWIFNTTIHPTLLQTYNFMRSMHCNIGISMHKDKTLVRTRIETCCKFSWLWHYSHCAILYDYPPQTDRSIYCTLAVNSYYQAIAHVESVCVCVWIQVNDWTQHSPETLVVSLLFPSPLCNVMFMKWRTFPLQQQKRHFIHRHPTIRFTSTDRCGSQDDEQKWRYILFHFKR